MQADRSAKGTATWKGFASPLLLNKINSGSLPLVKTNKQKRVFYI